MWNDKIQILTFMTMTEKFPVNLQTPDHIVTLESVRV